jgi:hypothetical protein
MEKSMNELEAVGSALSSLKIASDIATALVGIRDSAKLQEKTIELREAIIAAQDSALAARQNQSSLLEEVSKLKEQLARIEDWKAERDRYELMQFPTGSFAYRLKDQAEPVEPTHHICANCYNDGKKSILHVRTHSDGYQRMTCQRCDKYIDTAKANDSAYRSSRIAPWP